MMSHDQMKERIQKEVYRILKKRGAKKGIARLKRITTAAFDSMKKWSDIAEGEEGDYGFLNCPLCMLFAENPPSVTPNCNLCPVKWVTGYHQCTLTPYIDWSALGIRKLDTRTLYETAIENLEGMYSKPVRNASEEDILEEMQRIREAGVRVAREETYFLLKVYAILNLIVKELEVTYDSK